MMNIQTLKREKTLWQMTDDELIAVREDAARRQVIARNLEFECGFHQMLRKNVKREHLKEQVAKLTAEIFALDGTTP